MGPYANAWLSEDGGRRIDYLPSGTAYVLEETKAPEGFIKADPILVKVGEEHEIQQHEIFNEKNALAVSKRSSVTGKELAGCRTCPLTRQMNMEAESDRVLSD